MKKLRIIVSQILFFLPLGVYFLPFFQTHYEEDILLLGVSIYILLRMLNRQRMDLPEGIHTGVLFLLTSILHGIGWLGLVRGYLDNWGRLLALYPVLLLAACLLRPSAEQKTNSFEKGLQITALTLLISIFFITLLWDLAAVEQVAQAVQFSFSTAFPILTLILLFGITLLACPGMLRLNSFFGNFKLFLISSLLLGVVWQENLQTWYLWHMAGEHERGWVPHKHTDPELIAQAQMAPYRAIPYYQQVHDRIAYKGFIPRYLNWQFFMKYRMAYQAMRKTNPPLCARLLPVRMEYPEDKIQLLRNLWHIDFINLLPDTEPDYDFQQNIWVDLEFNSKGVLYALDCWGRVFSRQNGVFMPEYVPDDIFNDAVDLELSGDRFIYARRNGDFYPPEIFTPIAQNQPKPLTEGKVQDFEITADKNTLVVCTDFGEVFLYGKPVTDFPQRKFYLNRAVISDLELDPDGRGYYMLDIFGAVHSNHLDNTPSIPHQAPEIPKELLPYWMNQSMAIDIELDPNLRGIYIYNRLGEMYTITPQPYLETYRPPKTYPQRGVALQITSDGIIYGLESNGQAVRIADLQP
ncbi:MAG: hypothetical protein ACOX5R_18570 [bacterium]|jgi:hypothetical protein